MQAPPDVHHYEHHGLLGTVIDVRVAALSTAAAERADARVVAQIERLEQLFSAFQESSELSRWRRGQDFDQSADFVNVMQLALDWQQYSAGAFNPLVGELTAEWDAGARLGQEPDPARLANVAAAIAAPRFEQCQEPERMIRIGDCSALNLNALAKGYVVDRSLAHAMGTDGVAWICVNAGGDLAHRGAAFVDVGIENPHRPYDNEPPIAVVRIANMALATSGTARRGFRVGDRWFGHVLDPRTGTPVDAIRSISVVAADAVRADVLATIAGVDPPADAVRCIEEHGAEGLVVDRDGVQWPTAGWSALLVSGS